MFYIDPRTTKLPTRLSASLTLAACVLVLVPTVIFSQVSLPFSDNFEEGALNARAWSARPNLSGIDGLIEVSDGYGEDRTKGVYIGKSSDLGGFTVNALDLRLDLSGRTDVMLDFDISDNFDETHSEDGLFFSDNGGAVFVKVQDFRPEDWCDQVYGRFPSIDIDRLATKLGLRLTANFIVRFQQRGEKDQSGNSSTSLDGFYMDNVSVYDPGTVFAKLPFSDDFELAKFGSSWLTPVATATASVGELNTVASPMSLVTIADGGGREGSYGVAIGKRCDGPFSTNALDLHLNLEGQSNVDLKFEISSNAQQTSADDGLYFSDDGGTTFKKALGFFAEEWCNYTFGRHPPVDVDLIAHQLGMRLSSTFVIRFQQRGSRDFSGNSTLSIDGYFIDNLSVYNPGIAYAKVPFEDAFETGIFGDSWRIGDPAASSSIKVPNAQISPMNILAVGPDRGLDQSFGVALGRICDGPLTTNALNLHLDLENEIDVDFSFWIYSNADKSNEDDGIYFSDNGGTTFVKAMPLYPGEWCPYVWGAHPPIDVDGLSAKLGLALTSTFVIRIQQVGRNDFSGNSVNSLDGLILDEVKVYDPKSRFAQVPFVDNFETGRFSGAWAWRGAENTATISTDNAITTPMALLDVVADQGIDRSFAAVLGRRCDGPFSTNALDLQLDLNQGENIKLSFELSDNSDNTDADDGIYLSVDAGSTFAKIMSFDLDAQTDNTYVTYDADISTLAAQQSLRLSGKSIIRFQQRGNSDFGGNSGNSLDGYFLDNIRVTGKTVSGISQSIGTKAINVFPNPTSDRVQLDALNLPSESIVGSQMTIIDATGRIIRQIELTSLTQFIDVSVLSKGAYLLQIVNRVGNRYHARFFVQ